MERGAEARQTCVRWPDEVSLAVDGRCPCALGLGKALRESPIGFCLASTIPRSKVRCPARFKAARRRAGSPPALQARIY